MSVSLERLARNQVLFPEVNERLREMIGDSEAPTEFLCECSNADCSETIALEPGRVRRSAIESQPVRGVPRSQRSSGS
jgi:hypothetical protein